MQNTGTVLGVILVVVLVVLLLGAGMMGGEITKEQFDAIKRDVGA